MDNTNQHQGTLPGTAAPGSPPRPEGRGDSAATSKSTIAGVLDIIAGVMALIGTCVLLLIGVVGTGALSTAGIHEPEAAKFAYLPIALFGPLAVLCFFIGVLAVIGGIAAIRRRRFWLALVGSIAALFSFFPVGIPAIALTVMAEREFRQQFAA